MAKNVGLRTLMQNRIPLVNFVGLLSGRYLAAWPESVVADDLNGLTFTVQRDYASVLDVRAPSVSTAMSYEQAAHKQRR